jgi:hypothetical protein
MFGGSLRSPNIDNRNRNHSHSRFWKWKAALGKLGAAFSIRQMEDFV